jgi:hypothetical protein
MIFLPLSIFARSASHAVGTEDRNRTGTPVKEPDFESGASTSSATPAQQDGDYSHD